MQPLLKEIFPAGCVAGYVFWCNKITAAMQLVPFSRNFCSLNHVLVHFPCLFSLSNRMFNFDLLVYVCPGNKSFCPVLTAGLFLNTLLRGESTMGLRAT